MSLEFLDQIRQDLVTMMRDFGQPATYTPQGGSGTAVTVIFENDYKEIDLNAGIVSSSGPAAHCRSAEMPAPRKGDTLQINSDVYAIAAIKPNGMGLITLILRAQ